MITTPTTTADFNQERLVAALASMRGTVHERGRAGSAAVSDGRVVDGVPALEQLVSVFGLTSFEAEILLLCAGVELDSSFADVIAAATGGEQPASPTFGLALALFDDAHWSVLSPQRPLRWWRLVELDPRWGLTTGPLRIDERILHFLTAVSAVDRRLESLVESVPEGAELPPSQRAVGERIARAWARRKSASRIPAVRIGSRDAQVARAVARYACDLAGFELYALDARDLPHSPADRTELIRLWEREAALRRAALIVECDDETSQPVSTFVRRLRSPVLVSGRVPPLLEGIDNVRFDLERPTRAEQRDLWRDVLGADAPHNGQIDALVTHFDLERSQIVSMSLERSADRSAWDASRAVARPQLEDLAQRIDPVARWEDLILPAEQRAALEEIAIHVQHRTTVYEEWGFARKSGRGLGMTALFSGASGTGKTMAAEVLARDLRVDLFRIDLSAVVSKYIGETEKNLRRVFDAAEGGGVILLFDEADALFGKRSEVKDSHDRYANIEVGYLLQRMETYRGLAILTSNMKSALDAAFLRRIRFVIEFPFPDAGLRRDIWRHQLPESCPKRDLDFDRLAQLNVSGGSIRNIALGAAFLAVHESEPLDMTHVLRAARSEYAKLQRPLTIAESEGWR